VPTNRMPEECVDNRKKFTRGDKERRELMRELEGKMEKSQEKDCTLFLGVRSSKRGVEGHRWRLSL